MSVGTPGMGHPFSWDDEVRRIQRRKIEIHPMRTGCGAHGAALQARERKIRRDDLQFRGVLLIPIEKNELSIRLLLF